MSWELDRDEAMDLVVEYLRAMDPPVRFDDEWLIVESMMQEHQWGWVVPWGNRRAIEGSHESGDLYAGGGPYLVNRSDGRVAMAGSARPVEHYIDLWLNGDLPELRRPG